MAEGLPLIVSHSPGSLSYLQEDRIVGGVQHGEVPLESPNPSNPKTALEPLFLKPLNT